MASYVFLSIIKATSLCYAKKGVSKMRLLLAENYNSVVVSAPSLTKGNTYSLSACGQTQNITLSSLIYGSGGMGGGGMGGGSQPGGRPGGRP